jgi:hypothetical protein
MPTTSNFGWTTPADTDLVKDGALAIRTLGNGIDTSMAELKGGTTGQILSKTSNTDMDFTWIANDQGDITGVTAGTGISGGGTSGTVTITNSMATEITAAGDIIVGTGSGTFDNLPIGTTGQVLTADTTVSPYKVKWATASSGSSYSGVQLYKTVDQTISDSTNTVMNWASEDIDVGGYHDNVTNNSRITIPSGKGGYYFVYTIAAWASNSSGKRIARFLKNGSAYRDGSNPFTLINVGGGNSSETTQYFGLVMSLAATDYVEVQVWQNSGGNLNTFYSSLFGAYLIGA